MTTQIAQNGPGLPHQKLTNVNRSVHRRRDPAITLPALHGAAGAGGPAGRGGGGVGARCVDYHNRHEQPDSTEKTNGGLWGPPFLLC